MSRLARAIDNLISAISPQAGLKRSWHRELLEKVQAGRSQYAAAKTTRLGSACSPVDSTVILPGL